MFLFQQKELLQVRGELEVKEGEVEAARVESQRLREKLVQSEAQLKERDASIEKHIKKQNELMVG